MRMGWEDIRSRVGLARENIRHSKKIGVGQDY